MASYNIGPPIFADLILDTTDGVCILNVEHPSWLEEMRERQAETVRAGLVMRGTGAIPVWIETGGRGFECFSRVTGRISLGEHVQERKACIKVDDKEAWLDAMGNVEMLEVDG